MVGYTTSAILHCRLGYRGLDEDWVSLSSPVCVGKSSAKPYHSNFSTPHSALTLGRRHVNVRIAGVGEGLLISDGVENRVLSSSQI